MCDIKIHVYTVCWNEEKILPYFVKYYEKFSEKIIFYDNCSTDSSRDIINKCNIAKLIEFDTNNTFNDRENLKIKNTAYKESVGEADFVIVVDVDEFVFHPQLIDLLKKFKKTGVTLPVTSGYDMVSWIFPVKNMQIDSLVRLGRESDYYSKRCVFDPKIDINFHVGGHACSPRGNVVESSSEEALKILHYHYVGFFKTVDRHYECRKRLSRFNIENGYGYQFTWGFIYIFCRFLIYYLNSKDILTGKGHVFSCISVYANIMSKKYKKLIMKNKMMK